MTVTELKPQDTTTDDAFEAAFEAASKKAESHEHYLANLQTLSEASVDQHFDAFKDIDWDNPEFAIEPNDERWILPDFDALGATDWYKNLPKERQIEVGLYRMANITKVGLQFEQVLISGIMNHALTLPNNNPEFRYSTHEATEECHHTQMFQEFVNRSGVDVPGGPDWFRYLAPLLSLAGGPVPYVFFVGVLAGEEPIDHLQKQVLRSGGDMHPLIARIMQIHVAEEARHIGFAHQYLRERSDKLGTIDKAIISVLMPVIMRGLCDVIMKPPQKMIDDLGIPEEVVKEVWWDSAHSSKTLRDMFGDVRMLAEETGMMNFVSRQVWSLLGINGRPSRFRSEPASAAS